MDLFVNILTRQLVDAPSNPQVARAKLQVFTGERFPISLYFLNNDGTYVSWSADLAKVVKLAIGQKDALKAYDVDWTAISNGRTAVLLLDTPEMLAFSGGDQIFEVKVESPDGATKEIYVHQDVTVTPSILTGTPPSLSSAPGYYNKDEVDSLLDGILALSL